MYRICFWTLYKFVIFVINFNFKKIIVLFKYILSQSTRGSLSTYDAIKPGNKDL